MMSPLLQMLWPLVAEAGGWSPHVLDNKDALLPRAAALAHQALRVHHLRWVESGVYMILSKHFSYWHNAFKSNVSATEETKWYTVFKIELWCWPNNKQPKLSPFASWNTVSKYSNCTSKLTKAAKPPIKELQNINLIIQEHNLHFL